MSGVIFGQHLDRSEWLVAPCPARAARDLVIAEHYSHSAANTAVGSHGLYHVEDPLTLYGAALWMPPLPPAGRAVIEDGEDWRGVLVLSRLVVRPDMPTNAASFLLGRSMKLIDRARWPVLLTYADMAHGHTGAIYKATNWTEHGPVAGGDTWVNDAGEQRGRRRGPGCMTVAEMKAAGFRKVPAAPKYRFVHRLPARRKAA